MRQPKKRLRSNKEEHARACISDELSEFYSFREDVLPVLRKSLKDGATAEDIYTKFQAYAAARAVTIVAKEVDSGKVLAAIKDILDRVGGRASEKKEITHKLEKLPDEQLDALLLSKLSDDQSDDDLPADQPDTENYN